MRHLSDIPDHIMTQIESPAGASDDVYRITRRNGRVYEVSINEHYGYAGVCEVLRDPYGNEVYVSLYFAQGEEVDLLRNKHGEILAPRYILRYLDSAGALEL